MDAPTSPLFTVIGYAAAMLTTFCYVPQLLKTFRTKSVKDLHAGTLALFDCGLFLWLLYGLYLHSWPMILANTVTLGFQIPLLILKMRYDRRLDR
jgi:MtN3 and saliva related transmembrane protein